MKRLLFQQKLAPCINRESIGVREGVDMSLDDPNLPKEVQNIIEREKVLKITYYNATKYIPESYSIEILGTVDGFRNYVFV